MKSTLLISGNRDWAILILRIVAGLFLAFAHGLGKLNNFSESFHSFPDAIGLGSEISYLTTVAAEFLCALLVAFGLFTRIAAALPVIVMSVAAFVVLADAPFGKKESALIYLAIFLVIVISGPGKYSLDYFLFKQKNKISQ